MTDKMMNTNKMTNCLECADHQKSVPKDAKSCSNDSVDELVAAVAILCEVRTDIQEVQSSIVVEISDATSQVLPFDEIKREHTL